MPSLNDLFQAFLLITLGVQIAVLYSKREALADTVKGLLDGLIHRRQAETPDALEWFDYRVGGDPAELNIDEELAVLCPTLKIGIVGGDEIIVRYRKSSYEAKNGFVKWTVAAENPGNVVEARWLIPHVMAYGVGIEDPGFMTNEYGGIAQQEIRSLYTYTHDAAPVDEPLQTPASTGFKRKLNFRR